MYFNLIIIRIYRNKHKYYVNQIKYFKNIENVDFFDVLQIIIELLRYGRCQCDTKKAKGRIANAQLWEE